MLIECVPNVSEGRRPEVVAAMADAIRRVAGARLLDASSDAAHNRTVFTLVGDAGGVEQAVLALFERGLVDIDLRTHRGEHPRVGAVDVVPFVPLSGATMDHCVDLARSVGASIAARFGVPVFLYEEASSHRARAHLEDIRRGGLPALATRMSTPAWAPDFGPSKPHPSAGVSVVGARKPLIAFNVNLATGRIDVAKRIASTIRESGGGLPYVKALGLTLVERGCVQVSMNLTDYEYTPITRVFEAVKREAARYGVTVRESEIVGLVPAAALAGVTPSDLGLNDLRDSQILEKRLEAKS
jgi:glutamate formiminotransferase